jgi:hypothetical protein
MRPVTILAAGAFVIAAALTAFAVYAAISH